MDDHSLLFNALVYLSAAVISVPIAKKLGLGSVLGYLAAGIFIGPWGLKFINNAEDILHFSEFGVVLFLFLIGLELNPQRLWSMRKPIIGTGGAQVILTTAALFSLALVLQMEWRVALVAAIGLALSSTAIALQVLTEKNQLSTPVGNTSFSILLFQDIVVIPVLALLPLLAVGTSQQTDTDPWLATIKVVAVIIAIVIGGRYLTLPIFRLIASTRSREIFTAFSLLLVIGIALLMQAVDMSMALGTFLAGVLLAESEYRHQLESDLEPFKGLLLGLFFISVGMSIDFGLLINNPWLITGIVFGLVAVKMAVLFILGLYTGIPGSQRYFFTFLLSQGGEFAFVIFSIATSLTILPTEISGILVVAVALSMLTTPLFIIINDKIIVPRFAARITKPDDDVIHEHNGVIIAGFGRFGQIIARLLHAKKIPTTVIDHSPEHIERVKRFGFKVFYGDATRLELLESAGISKAKLLILATDDWDATLEIAASVKKLYPNVKILARAWDMVHAYHLMDQGVTIVERDTFESALQLGKRGLVELGYSESRAEHAANTFKEHDINAFHKLYEVHKDEEQLITRTQEAREDLEKLFEEDEIKISKAESASKKP